MFRLALVMATVCIQCALRALVAGKTPPTFEESADVHMARVHPDPVATRLERVELERKLRELGIQP